MPPSIAAIVFALGILGLFALDRDREMRTSKALWIPVLWILIIGSRAVSQWLDMAPAVDSPDAYLDGSPIDRFLYIVLLVSGLIVLISRANQVVRLLRSNGLILLFFGYCALSTLWSDYPDVAFKRWIKAVGDLVMVLVILTDSQPTAALKRVLARAGFVLLPVSILFIKYYPDLGRVYDRWVGTPSWTGVTTNKNSLGVITMILGVGAVWRLLAGTQAKEKWDRRRHRLAQGVLLAIAVWLLQKANSATSLSCFVMATILIVISNLTPLGRKRAVMHLLAVAMVFLAVFALLIAPESGMIESLGRDATLTGRTDVWHAVLGMTVHPLFGAGFESFWLGSRLTKLWNMFQFHPNEAHNGYLEVYLNLGWIGVTLLGIIIVTKYRKAIAASVRDPQAGSIRLAYIVAGMTYSLTEAGFRMLSPVWFFFLLSSIVVPVASVAEVPIVSPQTVLPTRDGTLAELNLRSRHGRPFVSS
jgi:exopolysaccharide production protein ExoQ